MEWDLPVFTSQFMVTFTGQTVAGFVEELGKTGLFAGLDPTQLLRAVKVLADVPDRELARLAEEACVYSHEAGAAVGRQGEFDDHLYVVLAGTVERGLLNEKGERISLGRMGAGSPFGRLSNAGDGQNMATLSAVENTHLLAIRPDTMRRLIEKAPRFAQSLQQAHLEQTVGAALRLVPLFAEAGPAAIGDLTRTGRLRVFDKGAVVFEKGDPGDSLYLVVSGIVKVYVKDRILAYLKSGAYFGEMALVKNEPRMASVGAVTDVEAFQIMKGDFEGFVASHGAAAERVRRTIEQREQENLELARHPERAERLRFMENLIGANDILVIDLERCIRCDRCVKACAQARGQARFERKGDFVGSYLIATACRQCHDPACMLCKRGAIVRDKAGEIHIKDTCIGCGFCAKQCPYGNILIVEVGASGRKKAAKCDLCRHLGCPPCVFNCPTAAIARLAPEELFMRRRGAKKEVSAVSKP
jgi:CRP-like cAMP-binding protein